MNYQPEKRSEARGAFRELISFEHLAIERTQLKNIERNGDSVDISKSGLGMTADVSLKRGQVVRLTLPASKRDSALPVFAEVRWTLPGEGCFRYGLRLLHSIMIPSTSET
jgi:hypothetical protein